MIEVVRWVLYTSIAPTIFTCVRYQYVSEREFRALRRYLREHRYMDWVRLGSPDAVTELFTRRYIGALPPIIAVVENIEDPVVQQHVRCLRAIDRFGTRIAAPFLMVTMLSALVLSVVDR